MTAKEARKKLDENIKDWEAVGKNAKYYYELAISEVKKAVDNRKDHCKFVLGDKGKTDHRVLLRLWQLLTDDGYVITTAPSCSERVHYDAEGSLSNSYWQEEDAIDIQW